MAILTNGAHASPGAIGEIITDGECKTLHGLLKLLRSEKHPAWLETLLERLTFFADEKPDWRPVDLKEVLGMLLDSVNEHIPSEDVYAFLYSRDGHMLTTIDPGEHEMMLRYLAVHRSGSWLAEFMDVECRVFETTKNRTPEHVVRGLVGTELENFRCDIDTTRRMLENHPDLFTSGGKHYMSPAEFKEVETHLAAMRASKAPATPPPASMVPDPAPGDSGQPPQYTLTMIKDCSHEDSADMTPAEFRELKKHLAAMRARKPRKGKRAA